MSRCWHSHSLCCVAKQPTQDLLGQQPVTFWSCPWLSAFHLAELNRTSRSPSYHAIVPLRLPSLKGFITHLFSASSRYFPSDRLLVFLSSWLPFHALTLSKMSLPSEVRAQYVAIIDSLLLDADLTTVSVKQVRNGIQEKVQYDITPHKVRSYLWSNLERCG